MHSSTRSQNFTLTWIEKLKPSGRVEFYTDGKQAGLQLSITPNGTRTFWFRARVDGKSVRDKLGRWPDMSLEDARKAVVARLGRRNAGEFQPGKDSATFALAFELWLDREARKTKRTWEEDQRKFDTYLGSLADKRLNRITSDDVERLHRSLGEQNGQIQANRCLALIKTVFNYAEEHHEDTRFRGPNPARKVKKYEEHSRTRYLRQDELDSFWAAVAAEGELWRDFFELLLLTGARMSNLREMKWADVDLNSATWTIPRTKNGEAVTLQLAPQAAEILRRRKAKAHHTMKWVFPNKQLSKPVGYPQRAWERILKRSGLDDLRPHDLRRTLGSWMAIAGVSELVIGKTLGHKPGSQATKVYARLNDRPVRDAVDAATTALLASKQRPNHEGSQNE